jgi:hypothetical protein
MPNVQSSAINASLPASLRDQNLLFPGAKRMTLKAQNDNAKACHDFHQLPPARRAALAIGQSQKARGATPLPASR